MASPATRIPPSIPKPHRKPLQLKNLPANLASDAIHPKKSNLTVEERSGKENLEISGCGEEMKLSLVEVSLGEEFEAERLRTERLRMEREKGEAKMREMDAAFDRWMRAAERRLNELLMAEMDIRRVVRAKAHRASCLKSPAFMSLRASEEKKRWQAAQLQEIGNAAGKTKSESVDPRKKNK
ncbi:hypothetical protein M5K25_006548 [Dendrobium thyrsiflorum]|uniref:Uncharacterized protein n=1 Tax=Dendrobium thyrsiflorum TaxID=117978 RepID=A0ABD0VIU9_DENTH